MTLSFFDLCRTQCWINPHSHGVEILITQMLPNMLTVRLAAAAYRSIRIHHNYCLLTRNFRIGERICICVSSPLLYIIPVEDQWNVIVFFVWGCVIILFPRIWSISKNTATQVNINVFSVCCLCPWGIMSQKISDSNCYLWQSTQEETNNPCTKDNQ